jgi:hypothetical protein
MRSSITIVIAACASLVALQTAATAQGRCPEGRTAAGECVNPSLQRSMQNQVIVFTQPKFSYTAPPYLPSEDRDNFIPRDHHEITNLFTQPPSLITNPQPIFTIRP